ncbi:MarR family winged helix-turn-helix transcriptional regulator [Streptomyces sp. NBC_01431]|uniref:MarR family winged helix-turn-helix transcriptional regulator n=1 Tax=Streptomyces sp. NBC_01431 TaxID=2903863 RepID=UPI002E3573F9|nr:MarR family transcriptional regulator [Streptomyces sp. NBC_01431]
MTHSSFGSAPAALINIASRALSRINDRRLRPLGLTFAQMPVLAALSKADALSQKELAGLARIEQPSMAQLLARMERDGLIRRTAAQHDRRVSLISLTEAGLAKLTQVHSALFETNDQALRGFSAEETDLLVDLLRRLVANLEENPADSASGAAATGPASAEDRVPDHRS